MIRTAFAQLIDHSPLLEWMPPHQRRALLDLEATGATGLALKATRQFVAARGAELAASLHALNEIEGQLAVIPVDLHHLSTLLKSAGRWVTVDQLRELSAEDLVFAERWLFDLVTKATNPTPEPAWLAELDTESRSVGRHEEVRGRQLLEGIRPKDGEVSST